VWCEAEPQSCLPKGRRPHGAAALRRVPGSKNFASCLKTRAASWSGHGRQLVLCEAEPQSCLRKGRRPHGAAALRHVPGSKNFASCLKTRAVYWSAQGWHLALCEAEPQSCLPKGRRLHGAGVLRHVPGSNNFASCLKTADSGSLANKQVVGTLTNVRKSRVRAHIARYYALKDSGLARG
jgi:hypothetical protein